MSESGHTYYCDKCNRYFSNKADLDRHVYRVHEARVTRTLVNVAPALAAVLIVLIIIVPFGIRLQTTVPPAPPPTTASTTSIIQTTSTTSVTPQPSGGPIVITAVNLVSGPSYSSFVIVSQTSNLVSFTVGPLAPGDQLVISYSALNSGGLPLALSLDMSVSTKTSPNPFTASSSSLPNQLGPGSSFTSTITISMQSEAGNSAQGATATFTFVLTGSA